MEKNIDLEALKGIYDARRKKVLFDNFKSAINLLEIMYIIDSSSDYINQVMLNYEDKCNEFIKYYNTGNMCGIIDKDLCGLFEYIDYLAKELSAYNDIDISKDMKKVMIYNEYVLRHGLINETVLYYLVGIFNKTEFELRFVSDVLSNKKETSCKEFIELGKEYNMTK